MTNPERAGLGPPFVRAGDLTGGDVIDLGGIPSVVLHVEVGPRAEPGDPRTVWVRLEGAVHARPWLETDPVRLVSDVNGRILWTEHRAAVEHARHATDLAGLHAEVGAAILAGWHPVRSLPAGPSVVYLAVVTATATAGGPVPLSVIGDLVDLERSTVRDHLSTLTAAGAVEQVTPTSDRPGTGRAHLYRPSPVDVPDRDGLVSTCPQP